MNSSECRIGRHGEGEEEDGVDLRRVGVRRELRK